MPGKITADIVAAKLLLLREVTNPAEQHYCKLEAIRRLGSQSKCGATLAIYLLRAKFVKAIDPGWYGAENLATAIKGYKLHHPQTGTIIFVRTTSNPADVKAGMVIVCIDANGNGKSDHITTAVGDAVLVGKVWYCQVCDNQNNWHPYVRNLTDRRFMGVRVGKTPMRGAIELL